MSFTAFVITIIVLFIPFAFIIKHINATLDNKFKYYLGAIKVKNGQFESIKESVLNHGFPIIKMTIFDKRYNFVLDTGANINVLDSSVLKDFPENAVKYTEGAGFIGAGDVAKQATQNCSLSMTYNKQVFTEQFQVTNLTEMFDFIEQTEGIRIHGMLGSKFFTEHQWTLDFEKMVIWTGK